MTEVQPASSAEAAQWLLGSAVDWWDLVRYGPPVFDVYVRIAFDPGPEGLERAGDDPGLRLALAVLATHTAARTGYAAIWEGWSGVLPPPSAPRVHIPNRTMLLFTGPVEVLRDAPGLAWPGHGQTYQAPHLVWPEDRAWCLACEVDEEIEFTVGCTDDAAGALIEAMPGAVRRVVYGEAAPMYRDPD
jgi:hypothetical protein